MNDLTRQRLLRSIEALPDAQLYQALDYVEFLAAKYAQESARPASGLQRFGERLEDSMRVHRVGFRALRGTLDFVSAADRVMNEIAETGRSLAREVEESLQEKEPGEAGVEVRPRIAAEPAPTRKSGDVGNG